MFGKGVLLFKLLGFEVRVDPSWLILAMLIVWTLAVGYFPAVYPGFSITVYLGMALAAAAGLFLSIVLHELGHSYVARRHGIPMKGITLFLFGGVAEMSEEPPSAQSEFRMAIAGPLVSFGLAAAFYVAFLAVAGVAAGGLPGAIFGYLATINLLLGIFNLIPAFPLDGGRVLRSILWGFKKDSQRATVIAARIGAGFGFALAAIGIVQALRADLIGGLWLFLIGLFLRAAATDSHRQVKIQSALQDEPLSNFLSPSPASVSPRVTLSSFVDDYLYRYHEPVFPVLEDSRLIGIFGVAQLKRAPREQWHGRTVGDFFQLRSEDNTVSIHTNPADLLNRMSRSGTNRMMVADDQRLVGIVSLERLLGFLALKLDLETSGIREEKLPRAA